MAIIVIFSYYPLHQARFIGKVDLPRFQVPDLKKIIDLQSIDAILISNYHTFTALPWITETGQEWNGTIYCTKDWFRNSRTRTVNVRGQYRY